MNGKKIAARTVMQTLAQEFFKELMLSYNGGVLEQFSSFHLSRNLCNFLHKQNNNFGIGFIFIAPHPGYEAKNSSLASISHFPKRTFDFNYNSRNML